MRKSIMTIDQAIHTMPERSDVKQREVADVTGIKESTLSRKLNMYDEGAHLTVLELTPVMQGFRDFTPLIHMNRVNGFLSVKMPRGRAKFETSLSAYQADFSCLLGLLMDFTANPTTEKIKGIDEACVEHMNKTAAMRESVKNKSVAQYEMDFTETF